MKKRLKMLTALAVSVFTITALTACGSKEEVTENTSSNVSEVVIQNETETDIHEEETETDIHEEETETDIREEEAEPVTENVEDEITKPVEKAENILGPEEIQSTEKFSEGRQWTKINGKKYLGEEKGESYICVDQEGNALYYVPKEDVTSISDYSNGYCFVETEDALFQIDSSGNVKNAYYNSDTVKTVGYADGQVWRREDISGFDSIGIKYTLYDANGEVVTEFMYDGTDSATDVLVPDGKDSIYAFKYHGKGVWSYLTRDESLHFYCTYGNKTTSMNEVSVCAEQQRALYFYEDMALLTSRPVDEDENGYSTKLVFMDTQGNLTEVGVDGISDLRYLVPMAVNEGYCVFYGNVEYRQRLGSYNIATGEFAYMPDEYAERVNRDEMQDPLMYSDGCVAIPLIGSDQKTYVGLFDTSWNMIGEPVQCWKYAYSDGKLVVGETGNYKAIVVYGSDGQLLYNASEKGCRAISYYENGMVYVTTSPANSNDVYLAREYDYIMTQDDLLSRRHSFCGSWRAVNDEGEFLFDTINLDHIQKLVLE